MKKILAIIIAMALVLMQNFVPMTVDAAGAGTNTNDGKITINDAISGKTYNAYQIFVLESYDTEAKAYSYTVATGWETFINSTEGKKYVSVDEQGYVTWVEDADPAAFAKAALAWAKANPTKVTKKTETASGKDTDNSTVTVTFTGLNLGYYLIDSSVGTICSLDTTDKEVEMHEKNSVPSIEKEISTLDDGASTRLGEVVTYTIDITVGEGAQGYVLHDTMSDGLTFNNDIEVYIGTDQVTSGYTQKTTPDTGDTFTVVFTDEYLATLEVGTVLTVKYTAVVNKNALNVDEDGTDEIVNTADLDYGEKHSLTPVEVITPLYTFDIVKTDKDNNVIATATFRLYEMVKGEKSYLRVIKVSDGLYRLADANDAAATTEVLIEAGNSKVEGLSNGTYYLEEVDAPKGYNKLAQDEEFTINGSNLDAIVVDELYSEGGVQVINYTGSELPSTGGIGTTIFVLVGTLLTVTFGVLLAAKLRMSKYIA